MSSPTSTRSFISPLLSALGIMSRPTPKEPRPLFHEFAHAKMPVDQFYNHLTHVYVIHEGLKRAETYYVSELRILKEPSKKLKTCHEYVIAVIKRTDGKEEENYLAFERSIGRLPQDGGDPNEPHPDRALERKIFKERQDIQDSDNDDYQEMPPRMRHGLVQKATASTTSLDSLRKKAVLADDRVLVLNRPYCDKDDKQVAVLKLQPPPGAVIPLQPSMTSSAPSTPRIRSRKLSDNSSSQQDRTLLHRTTSGPSAISYAPREPSSQLDSETTSSNDTPSMQSSIIAPVVKDPNSKPIKRKWIYLYEIAIIAYKLNRSKSLYRVFSKNCYWFAGMLIHVVRMWTDNILEVRDGNRVSHLQPNEDILSWYDRQMGKWMNVIQVVKTPMNYTLELLVEEGWAEKLKFEGQVDKLRLQYTRKDREREKRKEEELRKAREEAEAERKAKEEELQRVLRKAREDTETERRKREEEKQAREELQRLREEEKKAKEEELQRVRDAERKAKEEELRRVREAERKAKEELQKERKAKEEELQKQKLKNEEERRRNEEERRRNEEQTKRKDEELERVRRAQEETEQKMKLLMEYFKAGKAPPPELLAEIAANSSRK